MCRAGPFIDTRPDPELVFSSDNHECTWCQAQCSCMPPCNARQLDQRFCVQVCCVRSVATVATELIAMGITSKQNHSSRAAPGTLRTVCCSSAQCCCVRLPGYESQSAEAPCWQQLSGSAATTARCLVIAALAMLTFCTARVMAQYRACVQDNLYLVGPVLVQLWTWTAGRLHCRDSGGRAFE
jgi:hypothetical protein